MEKFLIFKVVIVSAFFGNLVGEVYSKEENGTGKAVEILRNAPVTSYVAPYRVREKVMDNWKKARLSRLDALKVRRPGNALRRQGIESSYASSNYAAPTGSGSSSPSFAAPSQSPTGPYSAPASVSSFDSSNPLEGSAGAPSDVYASPSPTGSFGASQSSTGSFGGQQSSSQSGSYEAPGPASPTGSFGSQPSLSTGSFGGSQSSSPMGSYSAPQSSSPTGSFGASQHPSPSGTYGASQSTPTGTFGSPQSSFDTGSFGASQSSSPTGIYGAPQSPSSTGSFGSSQPSSPTGSFGASQPPSPSGTYGAPQSPSPTGSYGVLQTPSDTYGSPPAKDMYRAPMASFGTAPSVSIGPVPGAPALQTSYVSPPSTSPTGSYAVPESPAISYNSPPSPSYNAPSESPQYSAPSPPPSPSYSSPTSSYASPAPPDTYSSPQSSSDYGEAKPAKKIHKFKLIPILVVFGIFMVGLTWVFLRVGFFRQVGLAGNFRRSLEQGLDKLLDSNYKWDLEALTEDIAKAIAKFKADSLSSEPLEKREEVKNR